VRRARGIKLALHQAYPASLDELWVLFSDSDYPERKYRSLGATSFRMLKFRAAPRRIEVEFERRIPMALERMPGWAAALGRTFADDEITLRHSGVWRRLRKTEARTDLEVSLVGGASGVPLSIQGEGLIAQTGPDLTRFDLHLAVDCQLPLIGGQIARLVSRQMKEEFVADYDFTLEYIQRRLPAAGAR